MTRFRRVGAFSPSRYVARYFPDALVIGDERAFSCIVCGKAKMSLNTAKSIFACFSCGTKGTMFEFIKLHLKVDDRGAFDVLAGFVEAAPPYDPAEFKRALGPKKAPDARPVEGTMPEGYRPLPLDTVMGRAAWAYLEGRRVTPEQIATHRIGVATRGKLAGCIVLPVLQGGRLVFWLGRKFMRSASGNKYLNPKNGETPLTASEVLFNLDIAVLFGKVTLVEGYFDALAEGRTGVPLLGKRLHAPQLELMRRNVRRDTPIRVKLDEDTSEAERFEIARQLDWAGFGDVEIVRTIGDPGERLGERGSDGYSFEGYIGSRVGGNR